VAGHVPVLTSKDAFWRAALGAWGPRVGTSGTVVGPLRVYPSVQLAATDLAGRANQSLRARRWGACTSLIVHWSTPPLTGGFGAWGSAAPAVRGWTVGCATANCELLSPVALPDACTRTLQRAPAPAPS